MSDKNAAPAPDEETDQESQIYGKVAALEVAVDYAGTDTILASEEVGWVKFIAKRLIGKQIKLGMIKEK